MSKVSVMAIRYHRHVSGAAAVIEAARVDIYACRVELTISDWSTRSLLVRPNDRTRRSEVMEHPITT